MSLDDKLMTDAGEVISFGRVKVPRSPDVGFNYEIPVLSFVDIKRNDGCGYIAICIPLQIAGYGKTIAKSRIDMLSAILFYVHENFKYSDYADIAWDNMYELSLSNPIACALWDKYHALQYRLAKDGIPTDCYSKLDEKIRDLQNENDSLVQKLLATETELNDVEARYSELWDSYLHAITNSNLIDSMIIEES